MYLLHSLHILEEDFRQNKIPNWMSEESDQSRNNYVGFCPTTLGHISYTNYLFLNRLISIVSKPIKVVVVVAVIVVVVFVKKN